MKDLIKSFTSYKTENIPITVSYSINPLRERQILFDKENKQWVDSPQSVAKEMNFNNSTDRRNICVKSLHDDNNGAYMVVLVHRVVCATTVHIKRPAHTLQMINHHE